MHLSVAEAGDGELVVRTRRVELGQVVQTRGHIMQHRATPLELIGVERLAWLLQDAHAVHEGLQRTLVLLLVEELLPAREQIVGILWHALELLEQHATSRVKLLLLCHASTRGPVLPVAQQGSRCVPTPKGDFQVQASSHVICGRADRKVTQARLPEVRDFEGSLSVPAL